MTTRSSHIEEDVAASDIAFKHASNDEVCGGGGTSPKYNWTPFYSKAYDELRFC